MYFESYVSRMAAPPLLLISMGPFTSYFTITNHIYQHTQALGHIGYFLFKTRNSFNPWLFAPTYSEMTMPRIFAQALEMGRYYTKILYMYFCLTFTRFFSNQIIVISRSCSSRGSLCPSGLKLSFFCTFQCLFIYFLWCWYNKYMIK